MQRVLKYSPFKQSPSRNPSSRFEYKEGKTGFLLRFLIFNFHDSFHNKSRLLIPNGSLFVVDGPTSFSRCSVFSLSALITVHARPSPRRLPFLDATPEKEGEIAAQDTKGLPRGIRNERFNASDGGALQTDECARCVGVLSVIGA